MKDTQAQADSIAVIGMAGRFPGARNVDEYWRNLLAGVESISFFTGEQMLAMGVDPDLVRDPDYVRAAAIVDQVEWFDPAFFGFTPKEADVRDPQHRLFLESAYEALEHAGYDSQRYDGAIGVYGGVYTNRYAWLNVRKNDAVHDAVGSLMVEISNHADYLSTLVSYKLNLRGPSMTVASACSSSLVATHLACQSLRLGECDMALAGGVEVELPYGHGYLFGEGGIFSPDGHCRPFDAGAAGTIFGSGVGIVVLKRLADALHDRDHVHAVIRGSAVTNDGSKKVGFTAPGVDGQVQVVAEAYGDAGVDPATIGYIEAHGTGTAIGDPIEVSALTEVFKAATPRRSFCAIGSVKGNIGHLGPAAGAAGLIKTVMALEHRLLPASLHYERPNPKIDFQDGPFFVNTELRPWEADGPRRAGVSSFGIGGTNVHAVLEEAPAAPVPAPSRPWRLVTLSARTPAALDAVTERLAAHLREHPDADMADVAHTLQVGRAQFPHRRALVCRDAADALAALDPGDPERLPSGAAGKRRRVVLMFPGQGAQHVDMARGLYEAEPAFRAELDRCARLLAPDLDLLALLFPGSGDEDAARRLEQTACTQPAIFSVEYALARLWMSWGVRPDAMIGHSVGEYVAACLAGVLTLEDALALVAARGALMQGQPAGAMLSVALPEAELMPLLPDGVELAAVNGPRLCVASGPAEPVERLAAELARREVPAQRLRTSHAFHSAMMGPILDTFARRAGEVRFGPPQIPFVSNLTGTWIGDDQAADPGYWAEHLRRPVRFADGLAELLRDGDRVLLEVGPGQALTSLARQAAGGERRVIVPSMRQPKQQRPDLACLLDALGRLWVAGVAVDWTAFSAHEERRRVPLPTYPFERRRCWVDPVLDQAPTRQPGRRSGQRLPVEEAFSVPVWRETARRPAPGPVVGRRGPWLVFADGCGAGARLLAELEARDEIVVGVGAGDAFASAGDRDYVIDPRERDDYERLFDALRADGRLPATVVHLWGITADTGGCASLAEARRCQDLGFFSVLFTAQALATHPAGEPVRVYAVTSGVQDVTGSEPLQPAKATVLGACKVIGKEIRDTTCHSIDVSIGPDGPTPGLVEMLLAELLAADPAEQVALRGRRRWEWGFEQARGAGDGEGYGPRLRERGVYLVTGGLGGIGLVVAEDLARAARARLVLVGRSAFPAREEWAGWLEGHGAQDRMSGQIRAIQAIEALGGEVLVARGDVTSEDDMRRVLAEAGARFGPLDGVVHAAGMAGGGMAAVKTREAAEAVIAPKVEGTLVLRSLLAGARLDFLVLCSSIVAVSGDYGLIDYVGANAFLDAFAHWSARSSDHVFSINWPAWLEVGMAVETDDPLRAFRGLQQGFTYEPSPHPLLDVRVVAGDARAEEALFVSELSPGSHWMLDEHRIRGRALVPGTAYLEMARAAFAEAAGHEAVELRDVVFLAPLRVDDGERREVHTRLTRQADDPGEGGTWSFAISDRAAGDGAEARSHVVGSVRAAAPGPDRVHDLDAIRDRCGRQELVFAEGENRGLVVVGPRWANVRRLHVGDGEELAAIEIPEEFAAEVAAYGLHPALLDGATAFALAPTMRDGHFLPFGYDRVTVRRPLPPAFFSHLRHRTSGGPDLITCDIVLMDSDGLELVEIEGFVMKRTDERALAEGLGEVAPARAASSRGPSQATTNDDVKYGIYPAEGVEALRRILAADLGPQVVVCLEGLQRKIDRTASVTQARIEEGLAQLDLAAAPMERSVSNPYVEPSTELERALADLWRETLGVDQVGVEDDFFELGGDSLVAVQVATRLRSRFQVELPIAALFENTTVARLAEVVEEALVARAAAMSDEEAAAALASVQVAVSGE
jgi:acyl transferase domain-containing protein